MWKITDDDVQQMALDAQGKINKIYIHWTAGHYNQTFSDYHINITGDGSMYTDTDDFTEVKNHTYRRNTGAIGIGVCCAYGATGQNNLGPEPPTQAQLTQVTRMIAMLCIDLGLPDDIQHVLTHAEAADNKDGWYAHEPYGPDSTVERWDFDVVHEGDEPRSGGAWLRGTARWHGAQWGSSI